MLIVPRSVFTHRTRHPLQELVVDTFVPNDVALGEGDRSDYDDATSGLEHERYSIIICTGANACGKVCTC